MPSKQMLRTVALMQTLNGKTKAKPGESEQDYFKRLHDTAVDIQRRERVRKRRAVRSARKRNR